MNCTLMHKNVPVALLVLDESSCAITKIFEVINPERLPIGILRNSNTADRAALNNWWSDRSIPTSRYGIRKALDVLNITNTKALPVKCFGLSLSDQYWIKPENTDIEWKNINFFENAFSDDIGDALLEKTDKTTGFDFLSPDNTTDGCLKKRWQIIDGKRCLIKGGSAPFMQQPFNEVIATKIMQRLGIQHISYTLMWDDEYPYSVCEDFIAPETELVTAWRVMQIQKKDNNTSVYQHYINCCKALGIKDIESYIDQMIVLDYIIANEDRHQNNFGLIRNAETLEFIGPAPIFDSGSSLGYDKMTGQIISGRMIECKPFKKTHQEQLKLVTSFEWIDFDKLAGIEDEIRNVFKDAGEYGDKDRINAIIESVMRRVEEVHMMALSKHQVQDDIEQDVENDTAEDYGFGMNMQ